MKKKDKYIGGIVIASLIVVAVIIGYFKSQPKVYKDEDIFVDVPVSNENKSTAVSASKDKIVVEIKGEVKNPDVYIMGSDAIVKDLILEAGGITEKGDLSKVNQAMTLKKGDCITIPGKTEDNALSPEAKGTPYKNNSRIYFLLLFFNSSSNTLIKFSNSSLIVSSLVPLFMSFIIFYYFDS